MQLAVVIDVDGDIMYVPENNRFSKLSKPKLFDNLRDAQEECDKWNTGVIVNYETGESVPVIKSFTMMNVQSYTERKLTMIFRKRKKAPTVKYSVTQGLLLRNYKTELVDSLLDPKTIFEAWTTVP